MAAVKWALMFCATLRLTVAASVKKLSGRVEMCSEMPGDSCVVMASGISSPRVTCASVGVCSNWNTDHCRRFPWMIAALLLCSGDVESNPGPVRNPCNVCSKSVRATQQGASCDSCEMWTHADCCGIDEYHRLQSLEEFSWKCPSCLFAELPYGDHGLCDDTWNFGSPKQMVVAHLNICSLLPKMDEIRHCQEKVPRLL